MSTAWVMSPLFTLEWLGQWKRIEVIANQGQFPLLGVGLLMGHSLHIDYQANTVLVT